MSEPLKNQKHEAVVQAYMRDGNRIGWKAYASVYPGSSEKAARTAWSRMLKNAAFADRIAALQAEIAAKTSASVARTLQEMADVAFANALDYLDQDGEVLPFDRMSRAMGAAIKTIKIRSKMEGEGDEAQLVRSVELVLHDKMKALEQIGRHLRMFGDQQEGQAQGSTGLGERLAAAAARIKAAKALPPPGEG
jgi:phage terminase small subunit